MIVLRLQNISPFALMKGRFSSSIVKRFSSTKSQDGEVHDKEKRKYYYVIDDKGQLFLEDCKHRNFVSCFKEKIFLQRFYSWLRRNDTGQHMEDFPWISPCGTKEVNYVRIEDELAAIAFGDLSSKTWKFSDPSTMVGMKLEGEDTLLLSMGNSDVMEPFDPKALQIDEETGRFYHPITTHKYLKGCLGLLHPRISHILSDRITAEETTGQYSIRWKNDLYAITPTSR